MREGSSSEKGREGWYRERGSMRGVSVRYSVGSEWNVDDGSLKTSEAIPVGKEGSKVARRDRRGTHEV